MDVVGLDIVLQTTKTGTLAGTLTRGTVTHRQLMQTVSSSLASSVNVKDRVGGSDSDVSWGLVEISQAILQRNYGIDSLMIQHQGDDTYNHILAHTFLSYFDYTRLHILLFSMCIYHEYYYYYRYHSS